MVLAHRTERNCAQPHQRTGWLRFIERDWDAQSAAWICMHTAKQPGEQVDDSLRCACETRASDVIT